MERDSRNIYRNARARTGNTQERWAELIGVSPDSVKNYESGRQIPSDAVVLSMADACGDSSLCYRHLSNTSSVAKLVLPEIQQMPLSQAVVQLIVAVSRYTEEQHTMLELAADGQITADEEVEWTTVCAHLDGVIRAALQVKCAEGGI